MIIAIMFVCLTHTLSLSKILMKIEEQVGICKAAEAEV